MDLKIMGMKTAPNGAAKNPNQALWERGDFTEIAAFIRQSGEMGNWIPNDPTFVSQLLSISSAFTPPPLEGFVSPMTWGVESHIIERFRRTGVPKENISMRTDTYYFAHSEKARRSSSTCSKGSMGRP
jgi:hypothetical protein